MNNSIVEQLVEKTAIKVPTEFFKKWLVRANEGKLTPEKVDEHYADYEKELKWSMIRNKVVEEAGLKVSNDEIVDRTLDKIMGQFNMPNMPDEMREVDAQLRRQLPEAGQRQAVRERVRGHSGRESAGKPARQSCCYRQARNGRRIPDPAQLSAAQNRFLEKPLRRRRGFFVGVRPTFAFFVRLCNLTRASHRLRYISLQ